MIQKAEVRTYRMKPMRTEMREKVARSYTESLDLRERDLKCPYCERYIGSLFSDSSGHLKFKCPNCKQITIYNLGYFRRKHYRRAGKKN